MKARWAPASRARGDALGRVVDRVAVDVDHAVEVEHQQVVRRRQASRPRGPATVQLLGRCPYDAPMESGRPTVPPYVAGPLQLAPFRALLAGSAARRGPGVGARLRATLSRRRRSAWQTWQQARTGHAATTSRRVYLHEYSDSGLTVRGLVGCLDLSRLAARAARAPGLPPRGRPPAAGRRAGRAGWARCGSTRRRSCWSTAAPPRSAR